MKSSRSERVFFHLPVLLRQTVDGLVVNPDGIYVDGTVGGGGHAYEILSRLSETGRLIAIDKDPEAIQAAKEKLSPFGQRVSFHLSGFERLPEILSQQGIESVDGILLDLGVSSHQLDSPQRGFSYRFCGPLDMRMDPRGQKTAWQVVNTYPEKKLIDIFRRYGEERKAVRIARRICRQREIERIDDTFQLRRVIESAVPLSNSRKTLSRIFQAIRIEVNEELDHLGPSIEQCINLLKPKGRICVISYHSLEDRIVKTLFNQYAKGYVSPSHLPEPACGKKRLLKIITPKPISPDEEERRRNRRARSAKLRIAEMIEEQR